MSTVFPITFSIPEEKICSFKPRKTKFLSNLIPGKIDTYIYNTEFEYYSEYQKSYFAITKKKAGWDCLRHYEILVNKCLPYFPDIEECPKDTLFLFPKDLVLESNLLFNKYSSIYSNYFVGDEIIIKELDILIEKFINYTYKFLTTKSIAKYVLKTTNNLNAKNILYLSSQTTPDYLRCLTLHGFKSIFKNNCHDYPKISHIYKGNDYSNLYGKGMTYTNLIPNSSDYYSESDVLSNILKKTYDLIIYGSFHRGLPYLVEVKNNYPSTKIIYLCGEDEHCICYNNINEFIFVRELI